MRRRPVHVAVTVALVALAGCSGSDGSPAAGATSPLAPATDDAGTATGTDAVAVGPRFDLVDATADAPTVADGDDWSLPGWARPAPHSGFFSEDASPEDFVDVHGVDVSWRQLEPSPGELDRGATGSAQGMSFDGLDAQLGEGGSYWMRIFASGEDWAPEWLADECFDGDLPTYGPDYDGQRHVPIWDDCVWGHLIDLYRRVFADEGLAADPDLRFVYVPGAFTWSEFDYEMIAAAVDAGDLDEATYLAWYRTMLTDLVDVFGDDAWKLVFTGEDYPFGPFGAADDLLAREAVDAGMGVRTGITEVFDFHLNEAPAYGSSIQPDGHLVLDDSARADPRRVFATENECYTDCGYTTDDPYYAIRQSNLKALQLRMNWIYVVPGPSMLGFYPELWDWVRLSMGQTAATSPDAWAALRDAEDVYWRDDDTGRFAGTWDSAPFVRNLERWLVQEDHPGCTAHRSDRDVHEGEIDPDNGIAYEALATRIADGDDGLCFDLDPEFLAAPADVLVKVTYLDEGTAPFVLEWFGGASPPVARTGTGTWRTATFRVPALPVDQGAQGYDLAVRAETDDLHVRFVRVVRVDAPAAVTGAG